MKAKIVIRQTQTIVTDIGDVPLALIRDVLERNNGTFDGNWGPGDLPGKDEWTVDAIEVTESQ